MGRGRVPTMGSMGGVYTMGSMGGVYTMYGRRGTHHVRQERYPPCAPRYVPTMYTLVYTTLYTPGYTRIPCGRLLGTPGTLAGAVTDEECLGSILRLIREI